MTSSDKRGWSAGKVFGWLIMVALIGVFVVLTAACRGGGSATPPPATIIRVTDEPAATQPLPDETLPVPPTLPPLPTADDNTDPYPLPTFELEPEHTPTPIVYPNE